MKRREVFGVIGGALAPWSLAAWAQSADRPVIGFLHAGAAGANVQVVNAFEAGLSELGFVRERNVAIEYRWAEGNFDRLPVLAADLIGRQPSVIFASTVAIWVAKKATSTIPIVFTSANDPVEDGLIASISRPGGNVTGVSLFFGELGAKRFELLQELVPAIRTVALLVNPTNPSSESYIASVRRAVNAVGGKELHVLTASTDVELELAFAALLKVRADALLVGPDPYFGRSKLIVELANRHGIPAVYTTSDQVGAGGLISYGTDLNDAYRQAGVYVGRILKGEKPTDLPVLQPTKFELVINLKTAKILGLDVPLILQQRADEVIE